jgi:hypothetical protein
MRLLKFLFRLFIFCLLTVLTQTGGLVYLCAVFIYKRMVKRGSNGFVKIILQPFLFLLLYCLSTFLIVPIVAKPFGRVPMPITEINHLRPLTIWTCFLNRNYVRPELKQIALDVAQQMNVQFPGTSLNYLDANFPFIDHFPLLPHLSHNDGKKLDLSFCYLRSVTAEQTNDCPSAIGYGICEDPLPEERNTAMECENKGYWQYGLLMKIIPQGNKQLFKLDVVRTRALVCFFVEQQGIGKLFIEPHLKTRLKLTDEKIRFHGCQAVRHDDHIHVQLK